MLRRYYYDTLRNNWNKLDYRKVLGFLEQTPDNEALVNYQKDLEDFFHSEWFRDLCNLDGDSLMHRIQREQKAIGGIA